jgi:protein SCO1/2
MLSRRSILEGCLAITSLLVGHTTVAQQQPAKKQRIKFFGRVESVDSTKKTVTVKHGNIPGYMDAMTMDYSVNPDEVLATLHSGDDIRAIVYPDDLTLHEVQVVARSSDKKHRLSK